MLVIEEFKNGSSITQDLDNDRFIINLSKEDILKCYSDSAYFYEIRCEIQDAMLNFNNYLKSKQNHLRTMEYYRSIYKE